MFITIQLSNIENPFQVVKKLHLFGELAGLIRAGHDLVVEDREVERQTEANWMRGLHLVFLVLY